MILRYNLQDWPCKQCDRTNKEHELCCIEIGDNFSYFSFEAQRSNGRKLVTQDDHMYSVPVNNIEYLETKGKQVDKNK